MKNLIFLVVLGVAGYFSYQHIIVPWLEGHAPAEPVAEAYLPPIPPECKSRSKDMADAIYGRDIGRVSVAQLNRATRIFQTCLKNAGLSDAEINGTYDKIKAEVMAMNPGSSKGF
ncbi:MAG: hypothetical protein KJO60_15130 [Desulfofustis sp.]|nr:hypothetical protein [Desulfofustis sp.]NNF46390.1 hypothetical protein [Desulfofustis sp.]